jgi:ribosomal protein L3 glutamine methyltransferase
MSEHALFRLQQCTLAELIEAGSDYLAQSSLVYGHGTDNPHDESAWLALEACGYSPAEPLDDYFAAVNRGHLERAKTWYRQRVVEHTPVAYITGRSWFAGLEFKTDQRALIPRSPIAELICSDFEPWLTATPQSILDLCCGGGCIAIACAHQFPGATVHGSDLSADALQLAAENRQMHGLENRLTLFEGDLFGPLPEGQRYDLIVSNPPYVDHEDMQALASEFQHEPQMGLAAGVDGLDIVDRILTSARQRLTENGVLIVEVGNSQPAVEARYPELDLIWLEFEMGGAGVFLTTATALDK